MADKTTGERTAEAMERQADATEALAMAVGALVKLLTERPAPPAAASAPAGGATLPNYGRSKGQPIAGAALAELEYYAAGCRKSIADPTKARWHDNERKTLAAIEAEILRQGGGVPPPSGPADNPGPALEDLPF